MKKSELAVRDKPLKAELSEVEEERDPLRKQFLEGDARVYELERRHR